MALHLYNTYTRETEEFRPLHDKTVGIYVCGPTVYGPPHLGHVRGPVVFDVLRRYLLHQGYQVRFVRNVTDVGHLVGDADEGEDKMLKQAKLEQVQPMEVAQSYTVKYNEMIRLMNVLPPGIEPRATGHIPEQIEMIQEIIEQGLAYEVNGSVYFDVLAYAAGHDYGKLSGRVVSELMAGAGNESRELEGQDEKKNPNDFALWKKASPEHIMQWNSPWGKGYPGWHIECSAMSRKYLGEVFDIHGGGMDLLFPHHESEIAQSMACTGHNPARYWVHHNMITINGQKMAKSLNNGIKVEELFSGNHPLLEQAYSPMTLRFFLLQAHYRGTLDFGNEALQASEKGLKRLGNAWQLIQKNTGSDINQASGEVFEKSYMEFVAWVKKQYGEEQTMSETFLKLQAVVNNCYESLDDDMNSPKVIAQLFEAASITNILADSGTGNAADFALLKYIFEVFFFGILGMQEESAANNDALDGVMKMLLDMRQKAKADKNYALSDEIRIKLTELGFVIKDGKEGSTWNHS